MASIALGQYLGFGLLLPGFAAGLAFWALNKRKIGYPYTAAIACYAGHALWMLIAVFLTGKLSVLWDAGIMVGGSIWLVRRPSRGIAYVMLAYSLLTLGYHGVSFAEADKATTKALITHGLLDLTALSALIWGISKQKKVASVEKTPSSGISAAQRVWIALGVLWTVGCLLAALSTSASLEERLGWGLAVGGLPWGVWWVLRGFQHRWLIVGGFFGFLVLAGFGVYGWNVSREREAEAERLASYQRVPVNQVEVVDARLSGSAGYPSIVARIRNWNAKHTVTGFELDIRIYDCPVADVPTNKCDLIAAPRETVYLEVPPLQSRDITRSVAVPIGYKVRGFLQWEYSLYRVMAAAVQLTGT